MSRRGERMYQQELINPHLSIIAFSEMEPLIRKVEIFKHLPSTVLSGVARRIQMIKYKKGQRIILEETEAQGVFFVFSGSVKLTKQDEQGNEMIVCIKKKGEIFAEACLFNQVSTMYPATAVMLAEGELAYVNKRIITTARACDSNDSIHERGTAGVDLYVKRYCVIGCIHENREVIRTPRVEI
jgi:CRP-like cAMP-binding protein